MAVDSIQIKDELIEAKTYALKRKTKYDLKKHIYLREYFCIATAQFCCISVRKLQKEILSGYENN
jgi:thermostable 8-oxoguanine DNA glycosylase